VPEREIPITRAALLELKDEEQLVKDGYNLLDEKRILLAQEIRRQLGRLKDLREASRRHEEDARAALGAALAAHGLDELAVYPPLAAAGDTLSVKHRRLLGIALIEAELSEGALQGAQGAANPTPEARACARAYLSWRKVLIEIAACSVNLRRLVKEYIRTHRRAEALENVLLPEIEAAIRSIDEQLESQDQEEAARLKQRKQALEDNLR
jgi:V/A-type H+/Na+-transporting ATPase subunit D